MKCTVNGELMELGEGMTLEALVEELGMGEMVCASEVDGELVRKGDRGGCVLGDGQRVEIVTLIGGG